MGPTASLVTLRPVISLASEGPPTLTSPEYATISPYASRSFLFLPNGAVVQPYRHGGSAGSVPPEATVSVVPLPRPASQATRSAGSPCTITGAAPAWPGPIRNSCRRGPSAPIRHGGGPPPPPAEPRTPGRGRG